MSSDDLIKLLLLLVGSCCLFAGGLAYLGHWTSWASKDWYLRPYGFSLLYIGLGVVLLAVEGYLNTYYPVTPWLFFAWGPLFIGGVVSTIWMPKCLTPKWFQEGQERRYQVERELADQNTEKKSQKDL